MAKDIPESVITGEAKNYIKDKAKDVVNNVVSGITAPSNEQKFIESEDGQQFLDDAEFLRNVYEASLLEGKDDNAILDYIHKRYPEEVAHTEDGSWDDDVADAWLSNKVNGIKSVWETYPKLASSNNYVIDNVDGEYQYVPMTDENKHLPKTTGQWIQSVATDASRNGYAMETAPLRDAVAKYMGLEYYPSKASNHPILTSVFLPRSGDMLYDDEAKTKMGGFGKAVAGDVGELALTAMPLGAVAKGAEKGLELGYRGAKALNMARGAERIADVSKGLQKAMYNYNRIADSGKGVGSLASRFVKGGAENVAQALAAEGAGDAYDAVAGTDRGNGMVSAEEGLDGINALITAVAGGVGKVVGNAPKASDAREELWNKLLNTEWGADVLEQRARMGKPWRFASDIDPKWLDQYVNGGGISTETFARGAYDGKNFPKIRIKQEANPINNRNARIDQRNAIADVRNAEASEYNRGVDELSQEIADRENALRIQGADFEQTAPDAERGLMQATETAEANKAAAIAEKLAKPKFVRAVMRDRKTGYPSAGVFTKNGEYYMGLADGKGGYKLSKITDDQATLLGVNTETKRKIDVPYSEEDAARIDEATDALEKAQLTDDINKRNYNWTVKDVLRTPAKDILPKKPMIPTMPKIGKITLRDSEGNFTPEALWYFKKNWKNLGYDSFDDALRSPNNELQKWLDMEESHLTDGWNKPNGLGSGEWMEVGDWQHQVNKRAPKNLQSSTTEAESIANTKNNAEYKLAKNNWELQGETPELRKELNDANAEYAMRLNQKMGHYKIPTDNSWQDKALKGARALAKETIRGVGKKAGTSDYQFERMGNEGIDYDLEPNSYYKLVNKKKIPTNK